MFIEKKLSQLIEYLPKSYLEKLINFQSTLNTDLVKISKKNISDIDFKRENDTHKLYLDNDLFNFSISYDFTPLSYQKNYLIKRTSINENFKIISRQQVSPPHLEENTIFNYYAKNKNGYFTHIIPDIDQNIYAFLLNNLDHLNDVKEVSDLLSLKFDINIKNNTALQDMIKSCVTFNLLSTEGLKINKETLQQKTRFEHEKNNMINTLNI